MSEISRRDALAIMGAVPLAAMLGTTPDVIARVVHQAQQARQQPSAFKPRFFTPHEWRTARVLMDLVIPRDRRSGSATDAGVAEFMDFMLMERSSMQNQMRGGLRWLDTESLERYGKRFVALTSRQQTAILEEIAWPAKANPEHSHGVAFFNYFRDFTASGFWSSKMGVDDIGYQGNQWIMEWNGCPPAALARLGVSYD